MHIITYKPIAAIPYCHKTVLTGFQQPYQTISLLSAQQKTSLKHSVYQQVNFQYLPLLQTWWATWSILVTWSIYCLHTALQTVFIVFASSSQVQISNLDQSSKSHNRWQQSKNQSQSLFYSPQAYTGKSFNPFEVLHKCKHHPTATSN